MTAAGLDPGPALAIGLPLAVLAGLALERRIGKTPGESAIELWAHAAAALAMTALYFAWHPRILVDDAGFIIRYLLQSDASCWYCFNAAEGPMFGISSFSHGALNLLLYGAGFGSPERCLLFSNVAGTLASSWLLLRILRRLLFRSALVIPLAFTTLFGAKSWMMIGATGMEVPLHTAIVLAALLALVQGRGPRLWFWLSMAVISKLDAVPIALVFGGAHLWSRRKSWRAADANPWVEALVWAGTPLCLWLLFSTWYFGSPLPHSAAAKLLLHRSTLDHWFPFLERYLNGVWLRVALTLFLILWPLHLVRGRRRSSSIGAETAAGGGFVGVLVLYYFYNPAERMEWYYALPDLLLVFQVTVSLQFVWGLSGSRGPRVPVAVPLLAFGGLCMFDASHGVRFFTKYLRSLEAERYAVGKYVAAHTEPDQTLLAGHGLLSAWTPSRVLDYSGINSALTLQHGGRWEELLRVVRPDAIIAGDYPYFIEPLQGLPYRIEATFYEIADEGAPPWNFFRKAESSDRFLASHPDARDFSGIRTVSPGPEVFAGEGVHPVWIARGQEPAARFLRMGILRPLDRKAVLQVRTSWEGATLAELTFDIPPAEERPERSLHWHGVVVPLDERYSGKAGYRVAFQLDPEAPMRFYGPTLTRN